MLSFLFFRELLLSFIFLLKLFLFELSLSFIIDL
jgi:hypothetical protein